MQYRWCLYTWVILVNITIMYYYYSMWIWHECHICCSEQNLKPVHILLIVLWTSKMMQSSLTIISQIAMETYCAFLIGHVQPFRITERCLSLLIHPPLEPQYGTNSQLQPGVVRWKMRIFPSPIKEVSSQRNMPWLPLSPNHKQNGPKIRLSFQPCGVWSVITAEQVHKGARLL